MINEMGERKIKEMENKCSAPSSPQGGGCKQAGTAPLNLLILWRPSHLFIRSLIPLATQPNTSGCITWLIDYCENPEIDFQDNGWIAR